MSDKNDRAPDGTPERPDGGTDADLDPGTRRQLAREATVRRLITAAMVIVAAVVAWQLAPNAMSSALLFLLILVVLVVIHELAHFFTAKMFGVYVHEFGIGFPPRVFAVRFGESEYSLNWLPIGGFVRLMGEEDPTHPRSLAATARWKRFIILVSGGVANLILPVFLFAIALTLPHEVSVGRAVVTGVMEGAPAEAAGLEVGDIIYTVGGRDATNVIEASRYVRLFTGQTVDIEVRRGEQFITLPVEARWAPPPGQGPTGIAIGPQFPFTETRQLWPWESLPQGARMTLDTMILARNEIISWFRGASGPQFAGPVGIAEATGEVARQGEGIGDAIPGLLELAALLSINLGIINLLPLPMLDGGRIAFLLLEIVRRGKRVAPEREALVHLVGLAMFIALAIVITFADISRIVSGESVFR